MTLYYVLETKGNQTLRALCLEYKLNFIYRLIQTLVDKSSFGSIDLSFFRS